MEGNYYKIEVKVLNRKDQKILQVKLDGIKFLVDMMNYI